MVSTVFFILHPYKTLASNHVRGLCLEGFAPPQWEFKFISPEITNSRFKLVEKLKKLINHALIIRKIKLKKSTRSYCYFIKPNSCTVLILYRFVFGYKVIIDINDPIHLPEHLGRFSKIKFLIMLRIANAAVYESIEYENFTRNWRRIPTSVIEDTPQFEISFTNYNKRDKVMVWFGSPATSKILTNYLDYFKKINKAGYSIKLLGADLQVVKIMRENDINLSMQAEYDHDSLLNILSNACLSFVPMPNTEAYSLRGNLKVKFSMATGCITIASDIDMHKRIIKNNVNGFLFSDYNDFSKVIDNIASLNDSFFEEMSKAANGEIIEKFNRKSHAEKICKFIDTCN